MTGEALPFESAAFEKELKFHCEIEESLYVFGNGDELKQLVSILLDNAVSHSKKDGEISCTLRKERNVIKLWVENTGEEIPPEQMENLFNASTDWIRREAAKAGIMAWGLPLQRQLPHHTAEKLRYFATMEK